MQVLLSNVSINSTGFNSFENQPDVPESYFIPYGLVTLGSILRAKGHGVEYLDLRMVRGWEEVEQRLREIKPKVLGCGFQTPSRHIADQLCTLAKTMNITTVVGGPHASAIPEDCLGLSSFDHILVGEGDLTFPEICESIDQGRTPPRLIHGEPLHDLDSIPLPYLSPLYEYAAKRKNSGFIVTSRGCPGRCKYCQPIQKSIYGNRMKWRSPESMLKEIDDYRNRLSINHFAFLDDTFTLDRKRINTFTQLLTDRQYNISYSINARADFIDEDLAQRLAASGCKSIFFGFESGSNHKLKLMNKQTTREQNLLAGKTWSKYGECGANILSAIPGELEQDLAEDLSFIQELQPKYLAFFWMVPFPGSNYYKELLDSDMLLHKDFSKYDMNIIKEMPIVKGIDYDMVRIWEKRITMCLDSFILHPQPNIELPS